MAHLLRVTLYQECTVSRVLERGKGPAVIRAVIQHGLLPIQQGLNARPLVAGGVLGQLFAWIAAVINTAKLEDKTWSLALVILGLLSIGFAALVAYLIEAPDEGASLIHASRGPSQ
jgi:hypothetical protein